MLQTCRGRRSRLAHRTLRADSGRERERLGSGAGGSAPQAAARPLPALQAAPAPGEDAPPEVATCRICWEGELGDDLAGGQLLLDTCSCSGSLAAVHARCLLDWQRHASDPSTCGACQAPVRVPPAVAAAVSLSPLWHEHLQRQLAGARANPALAAFSLWNWAVVATGLTHAALHALQAWAQAPAAAWRMQQQAPLVQRWQLLPSVACAAAYQAAFGPPPIFGRIQPLWLLGHAASFAAGLVLESLSQLLQAPAQTGGGAAGGGAAAGMRSVGGLLPLLLGSAALVLQVAGLQHLHPFLHLARGYQQGINRAFSWTARLLALLPALLPLGSGAVARAVGTAATLLPVVAHCLFRVLLGP